MDRACRFNSIVERGAAAIAVHFMATPANVTVIDEILGLAGSASRRDAAIAAIAGHSRPASTEVVRRYVFEISGCTRDNILQKL